MLRASGAVLLFLLSGTSALQVLFLSSVIYRNDVKVETELARALIEHGDNVTVIAPVNYDNFLELDFPSSTHFLSLERLAKKQEVELSGTDNETFSNVMDYVVRSCDTFYNEPLISRLIEIKHTDYDVIIVNSRYNECVLPVLDVTESTYILLSSTQRFPTYMKYALAIPDHPSYSPDQWSLNDKLTFTKRMKAFFNYKLLLNTMHFWYYRSIDSTAYRYIPSHTSLLASIQQSALVFLDLNLAIDIPLPTFNNVIPIGGIQCVKGDPSVLPSKILEFANSAENGFIFVSFGTVYKSSRLPYASLVKLVNVFSRVRQKVIWVFDDSSVIHLSENVLPVKYVNQQDILAHPKIVLFVSHGGHFSRQEAIYHGVPTIAFPLFDPLQYANADYIHAKKIGAKFDINAFSEEMLLNGIMEVITNPRFDENMQTLSLRMKDMLVEPKQLAVYWVHYAARSMGAGHMRSHSMHLYWFQYYLVDVQVFVIVSTLLVLYVVVGIILWCIERYKLEIAMKKQREKEKQLESKKILTSFKEE